jgi:hypothetical protein
MISQHLIGYRNHWPTAVDIIRRKKENSQTNVATIKLLIILPLSGVRIKINYTKSSSECGTFNEVKIKTRLLLLTFINVGLEYRKCLGIRISSLL